MHRVYAAGLHIELWEAHLPEWPVRADHTNLSRRDVHHHDSVPRNGVRNVLCFYSLW